MLSSRAELYGESVFTSFRAFNGNVPALDLHLRRLYGHVSQVFFIDSLEFSDFESLIDARCNLNKVISSNPNSYFRITVFANNESGLDQTKVGISDLNFELSVKPLNFEQKTLKLKTFSSPFSENYIPIKAGSYFQNLYFRKQAIRSGYDDALFTFNNRVTEVSTSNIVFQFEGRFIFPRGNHFLQGITLELFKEFCNKENLTILAGEIKKSDLYKCKSAFVLNSVKLASPVSQIDDIYFEIDEVQKLCNSFYKFCEEYK